jgi:hypothetical protein
MPHPLLTEIATRLADAYPALAKYIAKAADLVAKGEIWEDTDDPFGDAFLARSQSRPDLTYMVARNFCACDAGQRERLCYHRVARRLLLIFRAQLAAEEAKAAPAPAVAVVLTPQKIRRPTVRASLRMLGKHLTALAEKQAQLRRVALCGTTTEQGWDGCRSPDG